VPKRFIVAAAAVFVCVAGIFTVPTAGQHPPTLSDDLIAHPARAHGHRVIVQADDATLSGLRGRGLGALRRRVAGGIALEVTDEQLGALMRDPGIAHISGDLPVHPSVVTANQVTGATTVWEGSNGLLTSTPGYTGSGVTVAVLDSGIGTHTALNNRVVARVNFVSTEPRDTNDDYGHGTHVAGIIAGSTTAATRVTPEYAGGSAPGAKLVDVRVLGHDGVGLTSDVIAGIDWIIANRSTYDIRVVNLSLGHPVTEPSATDPLCQAVARAVDAGLVVVTAAGNYGLTADGAPVLGGITSPGDSPYALTVGATDTNGTLDTSDDVVAAYSSRGPAKYEMVVKPDVVAPGTRIVSSEAAHSYLSTTYPQWHIAGAGTNAYMRLSGTSMATPVVAGGVALLLDAYPSLTPAQVKFAVQLGARYMPSAGLQGGGAGEVNFARAMTFAKQGLVTNLLSTVTTTLGLSGGAAYWDDGSLADRLYGGTGIRLLRALDLRWLFSSADNPAWGTLNLLGLSNPLASTPAKRLLYGDMGGWTSGSVVVWGSSMASPSGQVVVWGSSDHTDGTVVVWGSSVVPQ
jgi:serine protease AprX